MDELTVVVRNVDREAPVVNAIEVRNVTAGNNIIEPIIGGNPHGEIIPLTSEQDITLEFSVNATDNIAVNDLTLFTLSIIGEGQSTSFTGKVTDGSNAFKDLLPNGQFFAADSPASNGDYFLTVSARVMVMLRALVAL